MDSKLPDAIARMAADVLGKKTDLAGSGGLRENPLFDEALSNLGLGGDKPPEYRPGTELRKNSLLDMLLGVKQPKQPTQLPPSPKQPTTAVPPRPPTRIPQMQPPTPTGKLPAPRQPTMLAPPRPPTRITQMQPPVAQGGFPVPLFGPAPAQPNPAPKPWQQQQSGFPTPLSGYPATQNYPKPPPIPKAPPKPKTFWQKLTGGIDRAEQWTEQRMEDVYNPRGLVRRAEKEQRKKESKGGTDYESRLKGAAGQFMMGMQNESEMAGAGDMMRGGGKLAGMIPGIGKPLESVFKFGDTIFKATDRLMKWSDQLHYANMKFAEWSGAMAGVQARQEVRDINLQMKEGNRRAVSAEYLAEGKSQLADKTSNITGLMADVKAGVAGALARGFGILASPFNDAAGYVRKIWNKMDEKKGEFEGAMQELQEASKVFPNPYAGRPKDPGTMGGDF